MVMKSLFPEEMYSSGASFTMEDVVSKLTYFQEQVHLMHWQTQSFSEHKALGDLYGYLESFRDEIVEKLSGYMGRKVRAYKLIPLIEGTISNSIVTELGEWAYSLYEWAGSMHYCDVENKAQELSGKAYLTKYLLTLS